jgi:hypothetical protein
MKNVVKISISVAMMTVATVFFSGCNKDDSAPSLVSGGFNGRVSATVDPEDFDLSPIKYVVPWNELDIDYNNNKIFGKQIGEPVSYNNNRFTINLPDPPPSQSVWVEIKYALENYLGLSGNLKYSNPNAQVTDVDFLAYDGEYLTGYFLNTTTDRNTVCIYVYADGDVTVTGGNVSLSLKEGWNRIYSTDSEKGKVTTKTPEGEMKWYYENF